MDNITHTLAGFALAEAGLKGRTRLGTAALVVGANLPDVDGLIYFFGNDGSGLAFRRGWTHGVLAMALLPPLLVAVLLGWHRLIRRGDAGVRAGWLLLLAVIAVWSHPLLDLLNTYGVRLLMPFSSRWFYGDALFIVDPWLWLALGLGIVLTRRRGARVAPDARAATRPARAALLLCALYATLMAVASRLGAGAVERQAQSGPAQRTLAAPVFANPFRRGVIRELPGTYELGLWTLGLPGRYQPETKRPTGFDGPEAAAAARTRAGAAFLRWARFPVFEAVRQGESVRVTISDVRYGGVGTQGWASVTVLIPGETRQAP